MFQLDRPRFPSLTDAFTYVLGQYALQDTPQVWERTASGLVCPRVVPRYLFRGECGEYSTTTHSLRRLIDARRLSGTDLQSVAKLVDWIARRLIADREGLDWPTAYAFIQHYGLPTRIVDFTGHLGLAFAFAAHGRSAVGRLAVMPYIPPTNPPLVVELYAHPWAERAQRQAAYGLFLPDQIADLKSHSAKSTLSVRWYEFDILPEEKDFCAETYGDLLRECDDPSAGFLRHYINVYVEAFGKFSPELTEGLLEEHEDRRRIPIAPYSYLVEVVEDTEAVVYFRGATSLDHFDQSIEAKQSLRYWSRAHPDHHSEERLQLWRPMLPGEVHTDPRTYHPDCYSGR